MKLPDPHLLEGPLMSAEDASALEAGDGWSRLMLVGDIDIGSVPQIRPLVIDLIGQEPRITFLDLSKVAFLDSSGLGLIAQVARASRSLAGVVYVLDASAMVQETLTACGLAEFVIMTGSDDERVRAVTAAGGDRG